MLQSTLYNGTETAATGSTVLLSTKTTVIGLATVEVVGTGVNKPKVIIQGKLINSSSASLDSGWVDVVTFTDIDDDSVVGRAIGVFSAMRAVISNNGDSKNIQVSVGYN